MSLQPTTIKRNENPNLYQNINSNLNYKNYNGRLFKMRSPYNLDFDRDALSHRLGNITGDAILELNRRESGIHKKAPKYTLRDYQLALLIEPQIRASIEYKRLRSGGILGQYTHSNPKYQAWVRAILDDMQGTIEDLVSRTATTPYFGFFTGEIVFKHRRVNFKTEWVLKEFIYHNIITTGLAGNKYGVTHVIDKSNSPHAWIPVKNCIYLTHDIDNSRNPYGTPSARAAMPYIKAKQALLSQWLIAGKNHATGLLIGKASSQDTISVLDSKGKPIMNNDGTPTLVSAVEYLSRQFETLEDKNYLTTDLNNDVSWMPLPVDANFFLTAETYLDNKILLSQNIPKFTFEGGSGELGSATPALQQQLMLDAQIHESVRKVKDQILEKVIKPMLKYNFGVTPQEGYGDFTLNPHSDPQTASLRVQNLLYAMTSGIINNNDTGAANVLRDLLGLPKIDEKEYLDTLQKSAELQAMQQQIMAQAEQELAINMQQENQKGQAQAQAQSQTKQQQQK